MASSKKAFVPHVVTVSAGETVDFPNEDKIHHNAFSLSGNCKFDLGLYKNGASRSHQFDKKGVCRIYCNIHAHMSGVVFVTDGNASAVTSVTGAFQIPDLPPGEHTLVAWHERARAELRQTVEIPAGATEEVVLTLDVSGFREKPHTNKYGKPYGKDDDARY